VWMPGLRPSMIEAAYRSAPPLLERV
jgi:hypothetical protein